MSAIRAYLVAGLVAGLTLEVVWPLVSPDEKLNVGHRIIAVLGWPVIVFLIIVNLITGNYGDDEGTPSGC